MNIFDITYIFIEYAPTNVVDNLQSTSFILISILHYHIFSKEGFCNFQETELSYISGKVYSELWHN